MGTSYPERIPLKVFIVVNGILFGFAFLMAAARIVTRFHSLKKLHPDDFVLMFACLTFIASQTLLYILKIENLYLIEELGSEPTNPQNSSSILEDPQEFYRRILTVQKMQFSCLALTFASIFAVKICFMLFFYEMITRIQRLILAWKVIVGITILFWAFCTFAVVFCSIRLAPNSGTCSEGRGFARGLVVNIISGVLDIISDLLLISIPLIILWKAKFKRQQKILFGIFLCLSVFMIIIAIIRISGFVIKSNFDMVWAVFWHQMEGAVAIIMVSLTAFRSLLGIKALKAREKKMMERYWFSHRPQLLARYFKKTTQDGSKSQQLPSVPGATLTGMRTFINGNGICDESKAMEISHTSGKGWPRAASHAPQEIELAHLSAEFDISDEAKSARAANFV